MKSPFRPNWLMFATFAMIIAFYHLGFWYFKIPITTPFEHIFFIALTLGFVGLGLFNTFFDRNVLHRKVKDQVDPWHLEYEKIYWLNGETHAKYVGINKFTGLVGMSIYGDTGYPNQKYARYFQPGVIAQYLSEKQEIFPKKKN